MFKGISLSAVVIWGVFMSGCGSSGNSDSSEKASFVEGRWKTVGMSYDGTYEFTKDGKFEATLDHAEGNETMKMVLKGTYSVASDEKQMDWNAEDLVFSGNSKFVEYGNTTIKKQVVGTTGKWAVTKKDDDHIILVPLAPQSGAGFGDQQVNLERMK